MKMKQAKINFDFLGKKKIALSVSGAIIAISIFLILFRGLDYNIEFNGGFQAQIGFYEDVKIEDLRKVFENSELSGVSFQEFGDESSSGRIKKEVMIKFETMNQDVNLLESKVTTILDNSYSGKYEVRQKSTIGPKVGEELKSSAKWALTYALLMILIYVSFRFKFKYALGAVVALFHDVVVTTGVYSLLAPILNIEVSLSFVAAILTIVGYSINDTIVIFDRIRENLQKNPDEDLEKLMNRSVNETLSRTIITSLTVLFVVVILFIFGGSEIKDISTALLIGVIAGTYSTVYIAPPIVLYWDKFFNKNKK